jgi:hypothetical protein
MVIVLLTALLVGDVSWAQREPLIPMSAVRGGPRLTGQARITYLLRQLDLTKEQREYARTLLDSIKPSDMEGAEAAVEEVYQLVDKIAKAREAGDKELEDKLTEQIRQVGRKLQGDDEFFMNMELMLTDEQKKVLEAARERLKRNPRGLLRPVDVFRAAEALDLTNKQRQGLERMRHELMLTQRGIREMKPENRFQLMNRLLQGVKSVLTNEQWKRFNVTIAKLRPDLLSSLQVSVPDSQLGVRKDPEDPAGEQQEPADQEQEPAEE